MSTKYHKIAGPFKRKSDSLGEVSRDHWVSPAVKQLQDASVWIATEKIDGMNMRIIWDGHAFSYAGRTDNAQIPGDLIKHLDTIFKAPGVEEWVENEFPHDEERGTEVIFVGEGYGAGIQKGGDYGPDKRFLLFDIIVGGKYVSVPEMYEISNALKIPTLTPASIDGANIFTLNELIGFVTEGLGTSGFGDRKPEGLVARTLEPLYDSRGDRIIVKLKGVDLER